MIRRPWLPISLLGLLAVGVLGAFPVRAYLDQLHERQALAARAATLAASNQTLSEQVKRLQSDDVVEELARSLYQLVRPGEEAYAILPSAEPPPTLPPPVALPSRPGWLSRAWSKITSIL